MELLVYLGAFVLITGSAFFLAWRSMKDFQDKPNPKVIYGAFLIQHPELLNKDFFKRIHRLGLDRQFKKRINPFIFALEKLAKGTTRALVIYGPKELSFEFPELSLMELEDYTQKMTLNNLQCFELALKKGLKLTDLPLQDLQLLKHFQLEEAEYLFLQIVMIPHPGEDLFQVALRIVVGAKDSNRRIEIAHKLGQLIKLNINLDRSSKRRTSLESFQNFQKRSLVPAQIEKFILPGELILKLARA